MSIVRYMGKEKKTMVEDLKAFNYFDRKWCVLPYYIIYVLHLVLVLDLAELQYFSVLIILFSPIMATTTKILVIGGTGWIGKFMVEASAIAGYPTFAFVRDSTLSSPAKSSIIQKFKTLGVNLLLVITTN